jgi:hypothetical protein
MRTCGPIFAALFVAGFSVVALAQQAREELFTDSINVSTPHVSTDDSVNIDYDIVYVRAGRAGDTVHKRFFTDFSRPLTMEPGADLMLLHPDGSEERLVEGGTGSVTDPFVSFDGEWVYYSLIRDLRGLGSWSLPKGGADIYKIHLKTRRIVRLTNQRFSPNTGAIARSSRPLAPRSAKMYFDYGVFNTGPCPLPGGRIMFTSNRDGFRPANGYPLVTLQLFTMDDRDEDIADDADPPNLEKIGHLNLGGALHPVPLKDGRVMFSSLESQGIRADILWGIWTIHPDGTGWNPLVSAFDLGGAPNGFHFEAQLSNEELVVGEYYNQNNSGFGAFIKLPSAQEQGYPSFGPANSRDPRNSPWRYGRFSNGKGKWYRMPFMPRNSICLTPFTHGGEGPADPSILGDKTSPAVGKFTHPSGAPDNHLLTCYSPGPANHQYKYDPQIDGGIYLIRNGEVVDEPASMRLIKNDPDYNECWPRAVVPYRRIYGVDEPAQLPRLENDGSLSKHLPEGSPFGLVGTSSFYKRESFPNGSVPAGEVTSRYVGKVTPWKGLDAFSPGNGTVTNWHNQGADAGFYSNDEIHAVRILAMEPASDRKGTRNQRSFFSHANERLRILGEIPLRKFLLGQQTPDPDGQPDTSVLAKIPADVGFTFQTLDRRGMVLNMSQTWHQLRPGEVRTDCGGCHAHSQKPTDFNLTLAAKPDYKVWDLTAATPLITEKSHDESGQMWDAADLSGLKIVEHGPLNVEYFHDIQPIFQRSCVSCHTSRKDAEPAGNLDLDADDEMIPVKYVGDLPGTYYRLAIDDAAKFGHKPVGWEGWGYPNASRYIRKFQSRRSLLIWKIFGARLDGFSNDDHPSEATPGSGTIAENGEEIDLQKNRHRVDLDYIGSQMPPDSEHGDPLSEEDRRTIVRWIELGCPVDLDFESRRKGKTGYGWMLDEQRPTLTLARPIRGSNPELSRIVVGMHDYGTGLDPTSFHVTATFSVDELAPGADLAGRFESVDAGVWKMTLRTPITELNSGTLRVSVADRQGNISLVERTFTVAPDRANE